jgi:hypothetical protein
MDVRLHADHACACVAVRWFHVDTVAETNPLRCVPCRLPQKRVLTLNLELPESWLVEPVMALHDLDNLRLADIPEQVCVCVWLGACVCVCVRWAAAAQQHSSCCLLAGLTLHPARLSFVLCILARVCQWHTCMQH